ncbi:MAG TPA: 2,3-bisphosphoglycerate-independent phosphoglycerate mutase [Phycisphaerales bacterium]|nr:2,3-bisphosphoglycerate-independent phosphoglycerate mutase [Phycisphaerales bacterium]
MTPAAAVKHSPLVLIIRDGWGQNPHPEHDPFNAIKLARTPVADRLMREYPTTLIRTSGLDVGLPEGTMGNSEVGHQNIGAGRIVDQESVRITKACRAGELIDNKPLVESISRARDAGKCVHLLGICSDAGVHGLLEHLYAILNLCKKLSAGRVCLHLFTDGRDTGPFTGLAFAREVEAQLHKIAAPGFHPVIASVIGRYWAMDRDNRWERTQRAWACLTGRGAREAELPRFTTVTDAIQHYYDHPTTETMKGDEFVPPCLLGGSAADADQRRIADGDTVIFYNYRGDRPRQISAAFVFPDEEWAAVKPSPDSGRRGFDRGPRLGLDYVMLAAYSEQLARHARVAFPKPPRMVNIAGEYLASLGLAQFRCAETEKFPHVTFFFNDYRDEPFEGEHREIIQSPKVATYDLQPEMSASGVRDAVLARLAAHDCEPLIVVNFANGDMVGHTGSLPAAVKACEVVDECVGAIADAALARGGSLIVTADHGNAEQMKDPATGMPHTAHTTYDVPLIVVGAAFKGRKLRPGGRLADIVPTALAMMGLAQPAEMTGQSLLA